MEVPKPFLLTAPDRLEIRSGGGCMSVFGVPFFLAGIFMILVGIQVIPMENANEVPFWAWPVIVLMGLAFLAVGGGLAFGRKWTVIDLSRASIMQQWGLLVPMKQTEQSLHEYLAVVLRFDQGDSDSADQYPVTLKARSTSEDIALYSGGDYGAAHTRAAFMAKFLGLPLEDATTERVSVVAAEQVDAPFQERQRSSNAPYEPQFASDYKSPYERVAQPQQMRSQTQALNGALQITIPGTGFKLTMLSSLIMPIAIITFVVPFLRGFFNDTNTPAEIQAVFIGFMVIVFGLFPLIGLFNTVIKARRQRTLVTVSPAEIVIEQRETWRTKTTRIPAADIIGLDYSTSSSALSTMQSIAQQQSRASAHQVPLIMGQGNASPWWLTLLSGLVKSKGITVKSRQGLFTFGAGLPDDEVAYLYGMVERMLGG